jgi:acylpyruvate hydrolase
MSRFANFVQKGESFAGVVDGDTVRPLQGVGPMTSGCDYGGLEGARRGTAVALSEVRLQAPVLAPGKVICLGLNYLGHVAETNRELPTYPVLFTKFSDAIIGPHDPIVAPPESEQVDYEAELAVVIGRPARRVSATQALDHVAGYTIANDVTMRDYQYKSHQWLQGKTWPQSTPLGPWLVTGDEIDDGRSLGLRLERNGVELQASNTNRMIFDVPTTIATLSEFVELRPGDVILMGTPDGVGFRRDPKVLLRPGDKVRVEIEGIGAIENEVVAEDVR